MYVRPRPRFRPRNAGGVPFSPALLFTSGVAGAWYDPSDINNYMAGLGSELVTNGDFSSASGWSTGGAWVISSGAASITSSTASLSQSTLSAVAGKTYAVTFTISAFTTGGVRVEFGGVNGASRTAAGTYTQYFTATSTSFLVVSPVATSTLSVDDISVKEVTTIANATLFQDSAGTTPVTAVEQPVGLMLDKSQGLVLGSEATSGAWLNGHTTTFDTFTSTGPSSFTATTTGAKAPRVAVLASLPAAGWSWIEFTATFTGGSFSTVGVSNTGSPYSAAVATTVLPATGVAFRTLIYTSAAREYLTVTFNATGASTLSVTGVSVKSLAGNHASQATAASRPVLRARYNLLTYSEQFDNAAWTKTNVTVTANATTAPDGTTTADKTIESVTTSAHRLAFNFTTVTGTTYTFSIYVKAAERSWVYLYNDASNGYAYFDLSNGTKGTISPNYSATTITDAGNGWYRISGTATEAAGAAGSFLVGLSTGNNINSYTGDGTSGLYVWGADLRTDSSAGTYQRIAAATDYATAGFLPYLYFVTDDSFGTNSIDFTGTNAMSVVTGYTKLSDTAVGMLYELGIDPTTTNGTFNFVAPQSTVDGSYRINVRGTTTVQVNTAARAAPVTDVSSLQANIAGPSISLRLNGAVAASSTSSMGTGNFANSALYIGRRNNSNFPINGNFYQMVICGKALSASELASTEAYVATKTGVVI